MKKVRAEAEEWLRIAHRIFHYRRDVIPEKDLNRLVEKMEALKSLYRDKKLDDPKPLQKAIRELEPIMKKTGGNFFPQSFIAEHTEMFLVAAFLAIGIRTFFAQPFKIPTNSMYPTYNGMTYELYQSEEDKPGPLKRVIRKSLLWASHYDVVAPADGEVMIVMELRENKKSGKKDLVYKSTFKDSRLPFLSGKETFHMVVGTTPLEIIVPRDFRLNEIFEETYSQEKSVLARGLNNSPLLYQRTGVFVKKGDTLFSFDILSGDMLFVDRFSYHFRKPKVGDPFVFRTAGLETAGEPLGDKYYIKRLVGLPGDTLEVRPPSLIRNGAPIEGADAFEHNLLMEGEYEGYQNGGRLSAGQSFTVPDKEYFAMGDNSDVSYDSRMWGTVPESHLVGKALFIYYPFTKRWGAAE